MPDASAQLLPVDVLSQTEFFAGLEPGQLSALASISEMQDCPKGESIYNHGQPAQYLYVLVEGVVQFTIGFGNRTSGGDMIRRGEVFGWAALTPGARRRIATATCATECTVLAIDGEACFALMHADHTLGFQLMKRLNLLITGTLTTFAAG